MKHAPLLTRRKATKTLRQGWVGVNMLALLPPIALKKLTPYTDPEAVGPAPYWIEILAFSLSTTLT
jgi:hypothetical protein